MNWINRLFCREPEFREFQKISRFYRDVIITEKIDGTNAQIYITDNGKIYAGCRTRWITPGKKTDNFGFASWVKEHESELLKLGTGRYFGEWFGKGIQRGYGLVDKKLYLFQHPGEDKLPICCGVIPILYQGNMTDTVVPDMI
jgi:hypothetical protein